MPQQSQQLDEVGLRDDLRNQLRMELDRDRQFVKDTIGTSLKVLGAALTIVVAVLSFVGYKTVGEIKKAAETKASELISAHIKESRQNLYEKELERLRDSAYVNSLVAKAAAAEATCNGRDYFLTEDSYKELMGIIQKRECDSEAFLSAVKLLSMSLGLQDKSRDGLTLMHLLQKAKNKDYWSDSNEMRLAALIRLLAVSGYKPAAEDVRQLMIGRAEDMAIRKAAVEYVGSMQIAESLPELRRIFLDRADGIQKSTVATAIAIIQPDAPEVASWLSTGLGADPEKMTDAMRLAVALDSTGNNAMTIGLFRGFVNGGYYIQGPSPLDDEWSSHSRLVIRNQKAHSESSIASQALLGITGKNIVEKLLLEAATSNDLAKLRRTIAAFSGSGFGSQVTFVTVKWTSSAKLFTESHTKQIKEVTRLDEDEPVVLRTMGLKDPSIRVSWYDGGGVFRDEILKKFDGPNDLEFSLEVLRRVPSGRPWVGLLLL